MAVSLTPFSETAFADLRECICDGVVAAGIGSLAELVGVTRGLQEARPDMRMLCTLDDAGQASYTSMHSINYNNLDDVTGHDLSQLDPAAFEDGEHRGYLSTPSEFFIRHANLLKAVEGMRYADLAGLLDWEELVAANAQPDDVLLLDQERAIAIFFVPVSQAAEALTAFPNGYFSCDFNPMQNLCLARHLHDAHGLDLFGVGASYLGFWRGSPFTPAQAAALADDLATLYANAPADGAAALAQVLAGQNLLLLRYTES